MTIIISRLTVAVYTTNKAIENSSCEPGNIKGFLLSCTSNKHNVWILCSQIHHSCGKNVHS